MSLTEQEKNAAFAPIIHTRRGVCQIAGLDDGEEVTLRFRTHELDLLEQRRGCSVLSMLDEKGLGIGFLKDALIVGSAHMFKGSKKRGSLTETRVSSWIDNSEEKAGIEFDDLLGAVVRCVVGGLPNGKKMLSAMDEEQERAKQEAAGEIDVTPKRVAASS